jgi:hypothetical protein
MARSTNCFAAGCAGIGGLLNANADYVWRCNG